jgi:CheY-like chemotaxis protein/predicted regulator of Ras-like GTPase activity (Roadblock/LC7/MglB family)
MSSERSILVVDNNEGFATLLKESLEQSGKYRVALTTNGKDALQTMSSFPFDLAIVDLGLKDPDGIALARKLRQQKADLRLMLIPIQGEELPSEAAALDIQGVLPKPFFLPELPERIADALTKPVKPPPAKAAPADTGSAKKRKEAMPEELPASPPPAPVPAQPITGAPSLAAVREHTPDIVKKMNTLAQEVNADAVLLTCKGRVISHTGRLSAEGVVGLAQAVAESWRTSARVAQILGQELKHFEQSTEGGDHMFYSLAVAEDIILSVALRANVPLGMIRHRAKEAADALRNLLTAQ